MSLAASITWLITIGGGLLLLAVWLIEYDREFQSAAATRLPVPVISAHALLAVAGLAVWTAYMITDAPRLAWATVVILATVAILGLTMAARWIQVYRAHETVAATGAHAGMTRPPERNFPLPVVIGHGIFAAVTIVLVLLTVLGAGGS
jgi:hypothetical protein